MNRSGNNPKVMALLGVLVIAALYVLVLKPQGAELAATRDEAATAQQGLDDALLMLSQLGRAAGGDAGGGPQDAALSVAVPPNAELSQLLRHLQTIATDTGVAHASVSPTTPGPNPAGPGGSISLTINASGARDAIDAYLGRIRDLERMLVIEQVSTLTPPGEAVETQLQLTVRAFSTATPVTAPAA